MKKPGYFKKQSLYLAILLASLSLNNATYGQMVIHPYGSFCVGTMNVFAFSGSGSVSSWYVSGNGTILSNNGNSIQVQWNSPVSNAYVTAYYNFGSSSVSYYNITISASVTPSVTINVNNNSICAGGSAIFTATPVNGGSAPSYSWYINGTYITGGSSNSFTTNSLTNGQQVTCAMYTSAPCPTIYSVTSNAITMTVNTLQSMSVTISGNTSVCQGSQASFSASVTNGTGTLTYQWKKNGNNISSDVTGPPPYVLVLNSVNNNDVITCVVSTNGCANPATSNSLTISIVSPQTFSIGTSPSAINLCQGASIIFTASPSHTAYNYQWYMNGSAVSGANNSTFTTTVSSVAQLQSVSVTANTSAGCVTNTTATGSSQYVPFTVNPSITPTVSMTVPATVILASAATFTANPINGGSNPTYQWQLNGVNVSGATGSTYAPTITSGSQFQTVSVIMNSNATCAVNPATITNTVEILSSSWENLNYVRVHTVVARGIDSWTQTDLLTIGDKFQTTTYLDGLGRGIQTIDKGISPAANNTWKDIVKHFEYDPAGRVIKDFLPYATATNAGKFKTDANTAQQSYVLAFFGEPTNPPAATYVLTAYDESPLNRVVKTTAPGKGWENSGVSSAEDFNKDIEKVHIWNLDYTSAALPLTSPTLIYGTGTLYKNITTDVNGKTVLTYTDLSGNMILKKVQESNTPGVEHSGWVCTYYVYDEMSRLRYTISPKAVAYFDGNGWNMNQTIADELCFKYLYDAKGRMMLKKQPGIGEEKMIYDKKDRVVMIQKATQDRTINTNISNSQWSFVLYDDLNRSVATGLFENNSTQSTLQGQASSLSNPVVSISASLATAGNITLSVDNPVASSNTTYLTGTTNVVFNSVAYYDNYNYSGVKSFNGTYTLAYTTSDPNIEATVKTNRTTGRVTGEKTRILDGDNNNTNDKFIFSTAYYDEAGRILETLDDNINMSNGSGVDYQVHQYDFARKLMSSYTSHKQNASSVTYTITSKNEFDKTGRLTKLHRNFNNSFYKQLAEYAYDELGQLKTKRLAPGYPGAAGPEIESLTYDYNIQGWLTGINKDFALDNNNYSQWGKYFGMYLGYDNRDNMFSHPQLNGNITGVIWKSQGDNTPRKFDFEYDNLDRFTKANFNQRKKPGDATWSNAEVDFTTIVQYEDGNGNIKSMKHMGIIPGVNTPKTIDDLQYSYLPTAVTLLNGNKLKQVVDQGDLGVANNGLLGDFKNTNPAQAYYYDADGNLTKDLNKNISGTNIVYNYLDKPQTIVIDGTSTINFIYNASGEKLRKSVTYTNGTTRNSTYVGHYVYEELIVGGTSQGDNLQYVLHEEGRLKIITSHTKVNVIDFELNTGNYGIVSWPGSKQAVFEYFIKDHLGNTRTVLTEEVQKEYYMASMEASAATLEARFFGQVDAGGNASAANELNKTRFANSPPASTVWPGNNTDVVKLTATSTDRILGPNMVLKVMAGDNISTSVKYYYLNNNNSGSGSALSTIGTAFVNSLFGAQSSSLGKNQSLAIGNNLTTPSGNFVTNFLSHNNESGTAPKAYLNIAFFDEQFKFVEQDLVTPTVGSWFKRVSSGNNPNATMTLQQKAPKNGWVYIYLTNESNEIVYFDDLAVTQDHSRIAEENHYYPYGLKIAAISSRAYNKSDNKYDYQGDFSEEEEETGWDEFDLRMYDPQIGRWTAADPYDEFASPYVGMGNNPINFVDEDGGSIGELGALIGAVTFGTLANWGVNEYNASHPEHRINGWGRAGIIAVAAIIGASVGYAGFESLSPGTKGFSDGVPWTNSSKNFFGNLRGFYAGVIGDKTGPVLGNFQNQPVSVNIWGSLKLPNLFEWVPASPKNTWVDDNNPQVIPLTVVQWLIHGFGNYAATINIPNNNGSPGVRYELQISGYISDLHTVMINSVPASSTSDITGINPVNVTITFDLAAWMAMEKEHMRQMQQANKAGWTTIPYADNFSNEIKRVRSTENAKLIVRRKVLTPQPRQRLKILRFKTFIKRKAR
jgi:RHS repeat-associated protein